MCLSKREWRTHLIGIVRTNRSYVESENYTISAYTPRARYDVMHIMYFTTAYESGIFGNRIHEEFLERLHAAGHAVSVFVPDAKRRGGARLTLAAGTVPVARAAVSANRLDRVANLLSGRLVHYDYFATVLRSYCAYVRAHPEIDLVHVESVYPLGAVAALAGGRPFVPTIRGGDLIADDAIAYGFARFRSVRWLLRLTFARAALVRAVSPGARDMAIRYGCPPDKIVVVPRHLRDDCFVEDVAAARTKCRQLIEERHKLMDRKIVVAVGRLLPVKGFDDLIRALPMLLQRVPDTTVLICGPNRTDPQLGDYASYLRRLMNEREVGHRVVLVGAVRPEQMAEYLAAADAVVVPSLIEGGNKILVEGAALGTPFVATQTAGTISFFNESHGFSIPPRNPERLAVALADLLSDQEAWQRKSAACLNQRVQFHADHVTTEMLQLYQDALQHRHAVPYGHSSTNSDQNERLNV